MSSHDGIGFQMNFFTSALREQLEQAGVKMDYLEVCVDTVSGPLETQQIFDPRTVAWLDDLRSKYPIVSHSNFGEEFGFNELGDSPSFRRHIPITHEIGSPWMADHMFYGVPSTSYLWSTPLQFSNEEVIRVAERAAAVQDRLKSPLLHENAFIYAMFPGSDIEEAEFLSRVVEKAGTHLLVDLHNVYANSVNFEGYDRWRFLRSIPLDKVIEIHIAGGQWIDGVYHDLHNNSVPEPVWEMLEHVLANGPNVRAITLEVQGPLHTAMSRPMDASWFDMAKNDLERARAIWSKRNATPRL